MQKKIKPETLCACIFGLFLLVFYLSIFYINFSKNPTYYDSDMYCDIQLAKEIWRQKTLFPDGWVFGNQVSVVSTPVLTALFYGIVGNGFTAMAIASSIMAVLVFVSFDFMLRPIAKAYERLCAFTAMMGLIIANGHIANDVGGMQLIFTMASYYSCYLITAFLAFGCYIRARENKTGKAFVVMLILTCALSFGTGMQSLRQTEFMTVPLIVCEGLFILSDIIKNKNLKSFKTKSFMTSLLISVSNIAGLIAIRLIDFEQITIFNDSGRTGLSGIKEDLLRSAVRFTGVFFQTDSENKSLPGLLAGGLFAVAFAAAVIFVIRDFAKNKKADSVLIIMFLLIVSFAETYILDIFTNMRIRGIYYFMFYPLFGLAVMYVITRMKSKNVIVALVLSVISLMAFKVNAVPAIKETALKTDWQVYCDVSDFVLDNGYDTVYTSWDTGSHFAAASDDKFNCGFWKNKDGVAFVPEDYLCNPSVFGEENNGKAVYILREKQLEEWEETAEEYGIEVNLLKSFSGESDNFYVYKATESVCLQSKEKHYDLTACNSR